MTCVNWAAICADHDILCAERSQLQQDRNETNIAVSVVMAAKPAIICLVRGRLPARTFSTNSGKLR